jgi:hypothetical protein
MTFEKKQNHAGAKAARADPAAEAQQRLTAPEAAEKRTSQYRRNGSLAPSVFLENGRC